ncbi:Nin1 binding protein [Phlyctochytrium planicorne]|nr:Nin1 binding protein [Phlyctochytrium planicorne]
MDTFTDNLYWRQPIPDIDLDFLPSVVGNVSSIVESSTTARELSTSSELVHAQDPTQEFFSNTFWKEPIPDIDLSDILPPTPAVVTKKVEETPKALEHNTTTPSKLPRASILPTPAATPATFKERAMAPLTPPAEEQPQRIVVVDANALIKGYDLYSLRADCFTIPEVIAEIKDAQSQQAVLKLREMLKTRSPSEEAFAEVVAFAKKTGDFATLSVTDLKVLALTYTLEKEQNGVAHVRREPVKAQQGTVKAQKKSMENMSTFSVSKKTSKQDLKAKAKVQDEENKENGPDVEYIDGSDDSDGEWITPSNIAKHKAKGTSTMKTQPADDPCKVFVGCITSDFAMQNVLLQMNLKLVSKEGEIIRQTKTWALRCHACFKLTTDMSKQFCPSCGNNTLMRASVSVDSSGKLTCYLKRNFQYNIRGTKYSIPAQEGGRKTSNLILREDQKEYEKAVKTHNHQMKKAMAETSLDQDFESIFKQSGGLGAKTGPGVQIGHGRKNPNSTRGRRR